MIINEVFLIFKYGVKKCFFIGWVCFCRNENMMVFDIICVVFDRVFDFIFILVGDIFLDLLIGVFKCFMFKLLLIMIFKFLC